MKYFIDQEFFTGINKPLLGRERQFIDLISIGIVSVDNREYYAVSRDFDLKSVWNNKDTWVRENVLKLIFDRFYPNNLGNLHHYPDFTYRNMKKVISAIGKTNKQIAYEIFRFVHAPIYKKWDDKISFIEEIVSSAYEQGEQDHEFYGYYADYDWVLFCSLFGGMMDLPKGFPMYCRDIKQTMDDLVVGYVEKKEVDNFEDGLFWLKHLDEYPKQTNEHDAIADARWNKKLHEFIIGL